MAGQVKSPQQLLWERWGHPDHPAEWDGRDGNGGNGSQRFWEYLWVLKRVPWQDDTLLDIGGGETMFLTRLLRDHGKTVHIVDPLLKNQGPFDHPVGVEQFNTDTNGLDRVLCVSVLEHVEDKPRFCAALDRFSVPLVMTFEHGPGGVESKTMYECLAAFRNHHLTEMVVCPILADNSAMDLWRPMGLVLQPNQ